MNTIKMKSPFFKKNYITGVPVYISETSSSWLHLICHISAQNVFICITVLLLWYTGKFALIQTCKYAPLFILVPRCKIRHIVKPWKKVKEAAYKVMENESLAWHFKETNYNKIHYYFNVTGLKYLYGYTRSWNVWDHKLLFGIKERWWRREGRSKRISYGFHNKRFLRDGHSQLLKLIRKTAILADRKMLKSFHYNTKLNLYRKMPWRAMSRLWGQINSFDLPHWLRRPAYNLYIWMFDCHVEEAVVEDISRYKNLSEFFRRMLKPGVRPIDPEALLTSPADGRVLYCGKVKNGALEQVKGVTYSLFGFLGPLFSGLSSQLSSFSDDRITITKKRLLEDVVFNNSMNGLLSDPREHSLFYCVVYLAPGDYHRFHSPADWHVQRRRHFPGELFSVKPSVAKWLKGLFNMNERVVYFGEWIHGFFSMTPVGATNVGSIGIYIDKDLKTNMPYRLRKGHYMDKNFIDSNPVSSFYRKVDSSDDEISDQYNIDDGNDINDLQISDDQGEHEEACDDPSSSCSDDLKEKSRGVFIKKGKLFGEFNLGSTIVLLFEAPKNFKFSIAPGQKIKYGQALSAN